jgi:type II secretory pathway predicted ATPase ExeA
MRNSGIKYNKFFGLSELPFPSELGQKPPFLAKRHEALLTDLVNFIIARQGIALLEGDSGVGKTVLAHALVQRIPKNFHVLVINGAAATGPMALTASIAQAMGINVRDNNLLHLNQLTDRVQAAAGQGKFYVVLLDDAHDLTDLHLKEIWVLSQMELYGKHLLSFILIAYPTLSQRLKGQTDQHLAKLIDRKFYLPGLTSDETLLYIDHMLHQVGSSFQACFAEDCLYQLFSLTGGRTGCSPRQINTICHQALERCWHEHLPRVTPEILAGKGQAPGPKDRGPIKKTRFGGIFGATAGGVLTGMALLVSLAAYALYNNLPGKMSSSISYRVTAKDQNLRKIVAAHYPNNEKLGFVATILGNPQITTVDLIYRDQLIILPEINGSTNIIKLNNHQYYFFYNRYSTKSKFNKALSKLQKLQIRYLTREIHNSTVNKLYLIYIGGYEKEEEIKGILTMLNKK